MSAGTVQDIKMRTDMEEKRYFVCRDWIIPSTVDLLKLNKRGDFKAGNVQFGDGRAWDSYYIAVLFAGMPFVPRHLGGIASRFNCRLSYSWLILAVKTQFHGLPTAFLLPTRAAVPLGLNEGNRVQNLGFWGVLPSAAAFCWWAPVIWQGQLPSHCSTSQRALVDQNKIVPRRKIPKRIGTAQIHLIWEPWVYKEWCQF